MDESRSILNGTDWSSAHQLILSLNSSSAAELLLGGGLDSFGVPIPPPWLVGKHRFAVTVGLLAKGARKTPPELRAEKVKVLDLRGLYIPYLPEVFNSFRTLKELYLDGNRLKKLPRTIGRAKRLRTLSLGRNHLRGLPRTILQLWPSLRYLHLGQNFIRKVPFDDYDMPAIMRGSVGVNPIEEPVGERWMTRKDALFAADRILELFGLSALAGASSSDVFSHVDQGLSLTRHLDEPMIFEKLFEDIRIDSSGRVVWNSHFTKVPGDWLRYAGLSLLPSITRGSMVHESLWRRNIKRLDLRGYSFQRSPSDLEKLPALQELLFS